MNKNIELANLLFPDVSETRETIINQFPKRQSNTVVTRFAPSPTGFLHIGGVYTALIDYFIAKQSDNGVFILRIEDTDKKREVANSKGIICNCFKEFNIDINEGVISEQEQLGEYGSYIQSERLDIYHALAKYLVAQGLAYPCFATEEELKNIRDKQSTLGKTPGYYREYAIYRDCDIAIIESKLLQNEEFVLRFRVPDNVSDRVGIIDLIKGDIEMENNINDFVLLKANKIPTYHFAHACDDYLMGTTIVIRGDEWVSSLPIHLQLFNALQFEMPSFAHVAPIMKLDGESRRKLSKRHDPESSAEFYLEKGYPIKSIYVYLLTLINSNFEQWYLENQNTNLLDFKVEFEHMSISGALYDLTKLNSISSEIIYNTSIADNVQNLITWASKYDLEVLNRINNDLEFVTHLFETQGPNSNEHRKDLSCYSEFMEVFGSLYTDVFDKNDGSYKQMLNENIDSSNLETVINEFTNYFMSLKSGEEVSLKELAKKLGYVDKKKYNKNPDQYRGVIFQFYKGLRILLTHQEHGISMDDIILVLGYDEALRRIKSAL